MTEKLRDIQYMTSDSPPSPDTADLPGAFTSRVEWHLEQLDIPKYKFLKIAGITEPKFYRWKNKTQAVSRRAVNRIAVKLAEKYDDKRKELDVDIGIDTVEFLLNDLLRQAGYLEHPGYSEATNRAWRRIQESRPQRTWRLGWVDCPPWTHLSPDGVIGISATIAQQVSRLLGLRLQWHKLTWDNLFTSLGSGGRNAVDAIAPILMNHPLRRWDVSFAGELPFTVGLAAVSKGHLELKGMADNIKIYYIQGEIGDTARYSLVKDTETYTISVPDAESAVHRLESSDQPAVFISESRTCAKLVDENSDLKLQSWNLLDRRSFKVSFGVHPSETRLRNLLDDVATFLEGDPYVLRTLLANDLGDDLTDQAATYAKEMGLIENSNRPKGDLG